MWLRRHVTVWKSTTRPTLSIHSLDLISSPARSAGSQLVKSSDSVGVPLALDQAGNLEPVSSNHIIYPAVPK